MYQRKARSSAALQGLLLLVLILFPLLMIFVRAIAPNGVLDLGQALDTLLQSGNLKTIFNSLLLGFCVTAMCTLLAAPLSYLLARTSLGRHQWLDTVLLIPFMTPPYIASMGWILFMQKRGLFQQLFPFTGAWSEGFFSFFGLVLVMSLHTFPFMTGILKNALLNMPSSLEESGAVYGGSFLYRLRRILLPLLKGNYVIGALLVFVKTISEYGTPATLGKRIGFYVFTTDIHRFATVAPVNFGSAAILSSVLVFICMAMWLVQSSITRKNSYRLVSGKGQKRKVHQLKGPMKALAWAFIGMLFLVAIAVPYFSVISTSLIKLRSFGLRAGNFTFDHYTAMFTENPKAVQAITNSLVLSLSSAGIAVTLGTWMVLTMKRLKNRAARVLEGISLLPEMLPSIVLIIGIMLLWNSLYRIIPLYNTKGIMVLAYVTLFLPYTIQYVSSSYLQISPSLLEAGRSFGGGRFYVIRRVVLPLLKRGILSAFSMTFIISFRELVTASLIAPPNTLVISTFITREFEQGSVSVGMAMAVLCVLITTGLMLAMNILVNRREKAGY